MNQQRIEAVCECLREQTRQMLKVKRFNPYFTPIYNGPSDVKKVKFEGLNIINIITGGKI